MEFATQYLMNNPTEKLREWIKGLALCALISLGFFLASLPGNPVSSYPKIFAVSLGYGLSIYTSIFLTYLIVESFIEWKEEKQNRGIEFKFVHELITCFIVYQSDQY